MLRYIDSIVKELTNDEVAAACFAINHFGKDNQLFATPDSLHLFNVHFAARALRSAAAATVNEELVELYTATARKVEAEPRG